MDRIELIKPEIYHKNICEEFKNEFFSSGEYVINGSGLLDKMEYLDWLKNTEQNRSPKTVRTDWVVSDTFLAICKSDGRLIGIIDIRHSLDNLFLSQYGGHIGYSVRPSERQNGYATEMLAQILNYAENIGLKKVMLGCYSDNIASKRTIEKCNGKLFENKPYIDGKMMDVYWIEL